MSTYYVQRKSALGNFFDLIGTDDLDAAESYKQGEEKRGGEVRVVHRVDYPVRAVDVALCALRKAGYKTRKANGFASIEGDLIVEDPVYCSAGGRAWVEARTRVISPEDVTAFLEERS